MFSEHDTFHSDNPQRDEEVMTMGNADPRGEHMDDITRVSTAFVSKRSVADGSSSGTLTTCDGFPVAKTSPGSF